MAASLGITGCVKGVSPRRCPFDMFDASGSETVLPRLTKMATGRPLDELAGLPQYLATRLSR
jgi:hypothetical protein